MGRPAMGCLNPGDNRRMTGGPLIVQSDKTLLLEVDHELFAECRNAIAPFAELERSPEHIHTYRMTDLGLWNAGAAGYDAEQVVDTLIRYSRFPVPHALLVDVADVMSRYGRLQLHMHPAHGLVLSTRPAHPGRGPAQQEDPTPGGRADRRRDRPGPPQRTRSPQAGPGGPGVARRRPGRLRRRRGARDRPGHERLGMREYQQQAVDGFLAGGSGVVVLPCGSGKTIVGAAAMDLAGHDADPGHQHSRRTSVEVGAAATHVPDRRGDRRVLRCPQGDPAGHDRDLPGPDHPAQGPVHAPGPVRRPRLGPDHLRRGPPAARARVPVHRRHPGPPTAGTDRHPDPRGRPRGRRLRPDRPQALRRALARDRGAGLDRPGRLHRDPRLAVGRRAHGLRGGRVRGAYRMAAHTPARSRGSCAPWSRSTPATRP